MIGRSEGKRLRSDFVGVGDAGDDDDDDVLVLETAGERRSAPSKARWARQRGEEVECAAEADPARRNYTYRPGPLLARHRPERGRCLAQCLVDLDADGFNHVGGEAERTLQLVGHGAQRLRQAGQGGSSGRLLRGARQHLAAGDGEIKLALHSLRALMPGAVDLVLGTYDRPYGVDLPAGPYPSATMPVRHSLSLQKFARVYCDVGKT